MANVKVSEHRRRIPVNYSIRRDYQKLLKTYAEMNEMSMSALVNDLLREFLQEKNMIKR